MYKQIIIIIIIIIIIFFLLLLLSYTLLEFLTSASADGLSLEFE